MSFWYEMEFEGRFLTVWIFGNFTLMVALFFGSFYINSLLNYYQIVFIAFWIGMGYLFVRLVLYNAFDIDYPDSWYNWRKKK